MSEKIKFRCACGKKLNAPAALAGKRAKCTGCGQVVEIPNPSQSQTSQPEPTLFEDFGLEPLEDLTPGGASASARAKAAASAGQSSAQSKSSSSAPPEVPQSIWDEEAEYALREPPPAPCPNCGTAMSASANLCMACGFNRQTGKTVSAYSASAARNNDRDARPERRHGIWQELSSKISFRALRLSIVLMVFGGICLSKGCAESRLAEASSKDPEVIALDKLIARGPEGNPNIVLTDFQICRNFVRRAKLIDGKPNGDWLRVWVPVVSRGGGGLLGQLLASGKQIQAILISEHVRNENQLIGQLQVDRLPGMVINRIASLGSEEKKFLHESYPGVDFDKCLIIEEGRKPSSADAITAYNGGGVLLLLGGIGLIVKRLWFD